MKISSKGVFLEDIISMVARPNICSMIDVDGASININTITLIDAYEGMLYQLNQQGTTIEEIKKRHNRK